MELFRRKIKNFVSILFDFTSSNASDKFSLLYSNIHTIVNVEVSSAEGLEEHDYLQYKLYFVFFISGNKWDVATRIFVSNPVQCRTHSSIMIQWPL